LSSANPAYKALNSSNELGPSTKTLIKLCSNESAEASQAGIQLNNEYQTRLKTGLEKPNIRVRDCPSLVGGRPAKSVVARPRGFKSHIPRHFSQVPIVLVSDMLF
jgi:hypothetical protein